MIGLMIRIRRDGLSSRRAGIVPKHDENRRPRGFRRLYGNTDIPDHARLRQHKTGLDGPDLVEDIMGKQRREQPQDSIFANNPFLDGLFEWIDSPEGQQSIQVRDVLWNLVEDVQLDAKKRKLIWPDAERLDLEQSIERVLKKVIAHADVRRAGPVGKDNPFKVRRMASSAPMAFRRAVSMTDLTSA